TLLVGEEPYEGSNEELLEQHKKAPVPDFEPPEDAPPEVVDFVKRLMAKWPWNRFEFAADARREWHRFRPANSYPSMLPPPSLPSSPGSSRNRAVSDINLVPDEGDRDVRPAAVATPGLLGVRPSPLVARGRERQELVDPAHEVTGAPEARHELVLLSGPAGVGKSRLAEWLCQEVHEMGLMLPLRARYRKIAAPMDG